VTRRSPALPFLMLYLAIALAFFLLMRDHAFNPTDDGFILAYSWRILQGEVPYRDFLYERTPLSPFLHLGWVALPDGWQIQAGRLAYYLELAGSGFVLTAWAIGRGLRASVPAAALAGGTFLVALHNFPPMPWTTVDGIFLASAGIAAFLRWHDGRSNRWLAAAVTLLTLSFLAKQTFAPILALAGAYAAFVALRQRSLRVLIAAAVPPAIIGAIFLLALVAFGALQAFVQQVSQPTQMRPNGENQWTGDFFAIALNPYAAALSPGIAVFLAVLAGAFVLRDRQAQVAKLASGLGLPLVLAVLVFAALELLVDRYVAGIVIFLAVATIGATEVVRAVRGRSTDVPLLAYALVLTMAWCASLSFAYQTPLLAIAAVAPLLAMTVTQAPTRFDRLLAALAFSVIAAVVIVVNVDRPYRETPRDTQVADLGEIYPRFGHLYTNAFNADRHRELRDLSQRFALDEHRPFVVLNEFPLAHFLSGTRNPLSLDWLEPQEYLGNEDRLRRELEASHAVILLERERHEAVGEGTERPRSCADAVATAPSFAAQTLARDKLVMESTYFCVYAPES
jgi:hypothetical protein